MTMSRIIHHLGNELRLFFYVKRRYWFETLLGFGLITVLFGGLIYAIAVVGDRRFDSGALDTMIVGFALWQLAAACYGSASSDVAEEMRQRTIEQLCLAPLSLGRLLGVRAVLHVVFATLTFILVWLAIDWLTDSRLQADMPLVLFIVLLSLPSLVGIGFAMGGLLLLFKRIETVHAMVYLGLITLVALPAYPINMLAVLPYALGAATAKAAATGAVIPALVYGCIAVNSFFYLAVGVLAFVLFERRSRSLGVLGHW